MTDAEFFALFADDAEPIGQELATYVVVSGTRLYADGSYCADYTG